MKRVIALLLAAMILFSFSACGKTEKEERINMEPQVSQMKAICELAVMDCYYHNVAKFTEKDAEGALFWKKDKHFWVEYSAIVKLGIDVSQVAIQVSGTDITITLPEAKVLGCKVESSSLNKDSFIVDKDSAKVTVEDEIVAYGMAQSKLEETASNDKTLLANAQQRAQTLLEDYITNIGNAVGKTYTIRWEYLSNGKQISSEAVETTSEN